MILTVGEVNNLRAILYQLRNKAADPRLRRNTLVNLCDKASLILNKAERRRGQRPVHLKFETGDFD